MRVYVFTNEWAVESGDYDTETIVFENFEDAQKELEEQIKQAKEDFEGLDTEEEGYCEGDMSWAIWEGGNYCSNHVSLRILEREVR